jgi:hypothetical protein
VGWRRARWKPISLLLREEKATEAVLDFLRKEMGKMNDGEAPGGDRAEEYEDEEWLG